VTSVAAEGTSRDHAGEPPESPDVDSAEHQAELAELYRDFDPAGMTPVWRTREGLMPHHPEPRAVPPVWRRDDGRETPEYPTLFAEFPEALVGARTTTWCCRRRRRRSTGRPSSPW
jgi:hypothetical protein